jgi:hypothetical protein
VDSANHGHNSLKDNEESSKKKASRSSHLKGLDYELKWHLYCPVNTVIQDNTLSENDAESLRPPPTGQAGGDRLIDERKVGSVP